MRPAASPPKTSTRALATEWKIILLGLGLELAAILWLFALLPPHAEQVKEKIMTFVFGFLGAGTLGGWLLLRWPRSQNAPEEE
jgi:hypothetical protein